VKVRPLLLFTAIVSSILGAVVAYLVLSVPNDLRADALLKQARTHLQDGQDGQARDSLARIVQQYPRTDAAAAATVALDTLARKERDELARAVAFVRRQNEQQATSIQLLEKTVTDLKNAPPKTVTVTAPAPAPKPAPTVTPKKKPAAPKKTTKRSTRRRR
jgi:hypothetical protein